MMDNEQKVSRKFLGMNSKVWLVIIIMLIISGGFVGYTMLKNEECVPIDFNVGVAPRLNDNFYYVGEEIPFKASRASNRISWNFNDDSDSIVGKAFVTHKFSKEGYYYVTLSTSLDCEAIRLVTIRNRNGSDTAEVAAMNKEIIGTSSTFSGREEEFISPISNSSSYHWVVLNHPEMGSRSGEKAKFQFTRAGQYIVQLTLDRDHKKRLKKQISVENPMAPQMKFPENIAPLINEVPVEAKKQEPVNTTVTPSASPSEPEATRTKPVIVPEKQTTSARKVVIVPENPTIPGVSTPKTIRVANETFKSLLQSVVENEMVEADFYKYLCHQGTTPVVVNGDKANPKTFSWLCQKISGKKSKNGLLSKNKSLTILSVKMFRDEDEAKCVNKIEVNY